jgi:hypothetical protein
VGDLARGVPYLLLVVGPFGRALPPLQFGSHLAGHFTDRADETTHRENEHIALRYLPSLIAKSPIVLESEGHGPQSYQGNVVLLVDRHTASAAEMVTIFAKENRLATVVGEKTAGAK